MVYKSLKISDYYSKQFRYGKLGLAWFYIFPKKYLKINYEDIVRRSFYILPGTSFSRIFEWFSRFPSTWLLVFCYLHTQKREWKRTNRETHILFLGLKNTEPLLLKITDFLFRPILIRKASFGLALWQINHRWLFNAKSCLYIWMYMILLLTFLNESEQIFWLVWFVGFYGISTFVGYLTPNPFLCK